MTDALFAVRNSFYLGAFQAAINEAQNVEASATLEIERDVLVHRAYIALGNEKVCGLCERAGGLASHA